MNRFMWFSYQLPKRPTRQYKLLHPTTAFDLLFCNEIALDMSVLSAGKEQQVRYISTTHVGYLNNLAQNC